MKYELSFEEFIKLWNELKQAKYAGEQMPKIGRYSISALTLHPRGYFMVDVYFENSYRWTKKRVWLDRICELPEEVKDSQYWRQYSLVNSI